MPVLILYLLLAGQMAPPPDAGVRDAQVRPAPAPREILERAVRRIFPGLDDAGWEEQGVYIAVAAEQMYAENGWDTEPDLFTLDLLREVAVIPPWHVRDRFLTVVRHFSDRYLLDEEQEQLFANMVETEAIGMFVRYAPQFMPIAMEAAQMRLAGEPYTAEDVARWSRELAPLAADARRHLDQVAGTLFEHLNPQQQELFLVDQAALNRRLDRLEELQVRWQRGAWQPADWGLEGDPIQTGHGAQASATEAVDGASAQAGDASAALPGERPTPPGELATRPAVAEDAWARYVREFVARYRLDDGQEQTAWRIYRLARERRDFHRLRHERRLDGYRRAGAAADDPRLQRRLSEFEAQWAQTEAMLFETLKRRLERLPTAEQRAAAAPPAGEAKQPTAPAGR